MTFSTVGMAAISSMAVPETTFSSAEMADDLADRVTQVGGNVVVDLGNGDSVTLVNTNADDVQAHPDQYFTVH